MSPAQITGEQVVHFIQSDYDLQLMFPRLPCLIKELLLLQYGDRDVIILGTDTPRLLKVAGSRDYVMKLFKLLDGTKSINELKAIVPDEAYESFHKLLALLFWYGLLQDGPIFPPENGKEQLAAFLGRSIGKTRFNRNRDEALQRLKRGSLAIYAPASVSEELTWALESAALGAYLMVSNMDDLAEFAPSFILVISDGSKTANGVLQFAYDNGIPCLLTMIGSTESRIGPLILPKLTVGHECAVKQLPVIEFMEDQNDLLFWSAFFLQETLLLMAGITANSYFNRVTLHRYGKGGHYSSSQSLAPLPGSKTSGLPNSEPLDLGSSAFLAWRHHCGTRLPPKIFVPPAAHQIHFSAKNLAGAQTPLPPEYGSSVYSLPESWDIPTALPWLSTAVPVPAKFNANSIANLLRVGAGHQKIQDQDRRISPTGGGLKSSVFFVRTRSVADIEDGWYAYNAANHALETIQNVDVDGVSAALPVVDNVPLLIVVVSHLQRTRDKYGDFGYNLVHLDAGVTTGFAALVADSYGWQICHYPDVANASLAHSLGIDEKDNYRIVSNIFSVSELCAQFNITVTGDEENSIDNLVRASRMIDPRSTVRDLINVRRVISWKELAQSSCSRSFEEVIRSRRSSRSFKQSPIKATLLEDLVRLGQQAKHRLLSEGMFAIPFNIYILRVLGDDELPSGVYKTNSGAMSTWKCVSSPLSAADLNRCLNQNALARAPLLFVMVANLDETLHKYGAAGYRHLLNQCGFVVGQIWVAAHAAGLVGTACGIVIEEGARNAINSDGYTKASIFGFAVGEPCDQAKVVNCSDRSDDE